MGLHLSDKSINGLLPRRSLPGSARAARPSDFAALKKTIASREARDRWPALRKGAHTDREPDLRPLRQAALKLLSNPSLQSIEKAQLDELAVAERMLHRLSHLSSLAPSIVLTRGLTDAVDVKIRALSYRLEAPQSGWMQEVFVLQSVTCPERNEESWIPLRHAVCSADAESYASARQLASSRWEALSADGRARIAFAFPDEPWANVCLRAILDDPTAKTGDYAFLLHACSDTDIVREFAKRQHAAHFVAVAALDVAVALGDEAVEVLASVLPELLTKPAYGPLLKTPPRLVAQALASFRTVPAARILAKHAGNPVLSTIVAEYFREVPELSTELVGEGASKAAKKLSTDLASARESRRVDTEEAAPGAVPALLANRLWRSPKHRSDGRVVRGVQLPDDIIERVLLPDESPRFEDDCDVRDMTESELRAWRNESKKGYVPVDYTYARTRTGQRAAYLRIPPHEGLAVWNSGKGYANSELDLLVTHGLAALPGFVGPDRRWIRSLDYEWDNDRFDILKRFLTPRIAPAFAQMAATRKKYRGPALAWMSEHASIASVGLIPSAVGPHGPERTEAEAALLYLATSGKTDVIRAAAAAYGDDVKSVVEELLARDPLSLPGNPPKPPDYFHLDDLPPLRLKDGGHLPADARQSLIELLSLANPEVPYAGFPIVSDAFDAGSLSSFVTALVRMWVRGGATGRGEWMLFLAVAFPSEASTRIVAELAREWARSNQVKAIRACRALALIGTDHALMHLGHIAETTRFTKLKTEARDGLNNAAASRGLTREELEDRSVPDLGLDSSGNLLLPFGDRHFVVSLDESLRTVVRDDTGARLPTLPKGKKTDDAGAVKQSKERFAALKKDVDSIASRQLRRLEAAMVSGRRWTMDEAEAWLFGHPLIRQLARALVWRTDASLEFRLAEDGTFADVNDDPVRISPNATVQIAHPVHLNTEKWSSVFTDYELLQPFEQLGRRVHRPAAEQAAEASRHAEWARVAATKLMGLLESRGWRRDSPGQVSAFLRKAATKDGRHVELRLSISPGFEIAYLQQSGEQTVGTVAIKGSEHELGALDPIDYSEVIRDLDAVLSFRH